MILADTSAWIQYLREPQSNEGRELDSLLRQRKIVMAGVVMAEILQGARTQREQLELANLLQDMPYLEAPKPVWLGVGDLSMQLRRQGGMIPFTDLLISALAIENDCAVYTLDQHFAHIPGVTLHQTSSG